MIDFPPDQERICSRCFHPAGGFIPFELADTESSATCRFERQVALHANRLAVRTVVGSLTYSELNCRANHLAHALQEQGLASGQVAILAEDGCAMVAAMVAALKIGRAFVALDANYPEGRLSYMSADADARCVVTETRHLSLAKAIAPPGARVLNLEELPLSGDSADSNLKIASDAPAYLVYTSGSTGQPKGVLHTHRSLLNNIRNYTNLVHVGCNDGLSALHSFSFSTAKVDAFLALLNGASMHAWNFRRDGLNGLLDWLERGAVSVVNWIPTPFRQLASIASASHRLEQVRLLMLGSEPVTAKDVVACRALFGPTCAFINRLGTTETGNYRVYFVDDKDAQPPSRIPSGYAVPGTEAVLLDNAGRTIEKPGSIGTIAVHSPSMSPGYWNKPEISSRSFISDPRGGSRRFYITGDLGRFAADGCLEFIGRGDSQVKVRGFRIELAEIEGRLMEDPRLKEAVVVAADDGCGQKRLAAYIVVKPNVTPQVDELRRKLTDKLPDYMVPWDYFFLEKMPTTESGKVDREALRSTPLVVSPTATAPRQSPRTPTESRLKAIWCRALRLADLGVDENFFAAGGDSLKAAAVFVEIESVFGHRLPLSSLLQAPTVRALAKALESNESAISWTPLVTLNSSGSTPPLFFAHGHQGNVIGYLPLAAALGDDQPFYAFQAQGLDGRSAAIDDFSVMAANYILAMKEVQPKGPYHLGGFCFGGSLAMEIARQLELSGETVATVITIQGRSHDYPRYRAGIGKLQRAGLRALRRFRAELEAWRRQPVQLWLYHATGRLERLGTVLSALFERAIQRAMKPLGMRLSQSRFSRQMEFERSHIQAFRRHRFGTVRCPVLVIRVADQPLGIEPDEALGWKAYAERVTAVEIPGTQRDVLKEPRVSLVAAAIQQHRMALEHGIGKPDSWSLSL